MLVLRFLPIQRKLKNSLSHSLLDVEYETASLLCPCWVLGLAMLIRLPLFLCMHGSRWGHPYTSDWIDHGTIKGKDRDVLPLRV